MCMAHPITPSSPVCHNGCNVSPCPPRRSPIPRLVAFAPYPPKRASLFAHETLLFTYLFKPPARASSCSPVSSMPFSFTNAKLTCLRTGEGWPCLATVIDLAARMVVGRAMPERMTADMVVGAPEMAHSRGHVADGPIFHSDGGSRYTGAVLARWARGHGVRLSVGRTGSCRDNAVAESFFGSPENEWHSRFSLETRSKARMAVTWYIETFCNRTRPHSSVGRRKPAELMTSSSRDSTEVWRRCRWRRDFLRFSCLKS